jgi:hypothetical protein
MPAAWSAQPDNALNSNTVLTQNNNFATWLKPNSILTALREDQCSSTSRFLGTLTKPVVAS